MQSSGRKNDNNVNRKRHSSAQLWTPPLNFAMVEDSIYRSAYPEVSNIPFLAAIGIKTIVLLSIESLSYTVRKTINKTKRYERRSDIDISNTTSDEYKLDSNGCHTNNKENNRSKCKSNDNRIRIVQISDMCNWQRDDINSGDDFSQYDVLRAIDLTIDTRWHPILLTCPTGELQTSVVVGCMRRYQYWSLSAIYNECELFSHVAHNLRTSVMTFIASWNPESFPIHACDIVHRHLQLYSKLLRKHTQTTPSHTLSKHEFNLSNLDYNSDIKSSATTTNINWDNEAESKTSEETNKEMVANAKPSFKPSTNIDVEHIATQQLLLNNNSDKRSNAECTEWLPNETSENNDIECVKRVERVDDIDNRVLNTKISTSTHHVDKEIGNVIEISTLPSYADATIDREETLEDNTASCVANCESVVCLNGIIHVHFADWFVNAQRYAWQREHNEIIYSKDEEVMNVIVQYMESINNEEQQRQLELTDDKMQLYCSNQAKHKDDNEYSIVRNNEKMEMLLPFIRYAGVRNPPAIDKRSSFTKESLVEDDDD